MCCSPYRHFTTKPLLLAVAIGVLCIVAPQTAFAQAFRMSAGVSYPTPDVVGTNNVSVSIDAANDSSLGGAYSTSITESLTSMQHQVSCTNNSIPCGAPENPPVFQIVGCAFTAAANVTCATAIGTNACTGVTFDIQPTTNPSTGFYNFIPETAVSLLLDSTPTDAERRCTVPFTVNVVNFPAHDANLAATGFQTDQSNAATGNVVGGPNDGQVVSGTGPNEVTIQQCASGACCNPDFTFKPTTTQCLAPQGPCDLGSSCTGSSGDCPSDTFKPATTQCLAPLGLCDLGSSCTGTSAACPPDTFKSATTQCGAASGSCGNPQSCTGTSASCPAETFKSATTQCLAPQGACDLGSSCTGTSSTCPPDTFKPATTQCAASSGPCGNGASCTGSSATCPPESFKSATTQCLAPQGPCDNGASCTGTSSTCPPDSFKPATTSCNAALCESCSGSSASCSTVNLCSPEACRTPGFWGTHGGTEKTNSVNITSLEIAKVGSLTICGETILPTDGQDQCATGSNVCWPHSPIEALCENPGHTTFELQVVFQLTAAALNCVANGHKADCSDDPVFGPTFAACNVGAVCAPTTDANKAAQSACVSLLDCLNNGHHVATTATGLVCSVGVCSDNNAPCSGSTTNCANPATATCDTSNCESNPLPGFDPPGPAGSSNACNDANGSACNIFCSSCTTGTGGGACIP